MNKLFAIMACSVALLAATGFSQAAPQAHAAPAPRLEDRSIYIPIRGQNLSRQHPGGAAPTVEALAHLFYEKAPEHAGKPVVIEYGWAAEHEMRAQADGRAKSVPTGRRVGVAKVQERALYERHLRRPVLGGGALVVHFDLETGRILHAARAK